jgi:heterodisulfide reductase subunit A
MTGMEPAAETKSLTAMLGLKDVSDKFIQPLDEVLQPNFTDIPGVFVAGACSGPKSVSETLADARSAALAVEAFLKV